MKYAGIDYGTKKVGVALSDENATIAFPHSVIPADDELYNNIVQILSQEGIYTVVIGHSLSMRGDENPVMQEAHVFKERLEKAGYTVVLEPEFFTSVQAKRNTQGTMVDASAAALILQSFLDKS